MLRGIVSTRGSPSSMPFGSGLSLRGYIPLQRRRHSWKLADICDFIDSVCATVENRADTALRNVGTIHPSPTYKVGKIAKARILGVFYIDQATILAARATKAVSEEVTALVRVVRLAAELFEVCILNHQYSCLDSCLCIYTLARFQTIADRQGYEHCRHCISHRHSLPSYCTPSWCGCRLSR